MARKLNVFNSVTLDGYFTGTNGDMQWAHEGSDDKEFNEYIQGNAQGGGVLLFGRVTYDMMVAYWPTPMAAQQMPEVAKGMNKSQKVVFSTTMDKADWENTTLVKDDIIDAVRKLKAEDGAGITILGSGSIVAQLAEAGLIDTYQFVVCPIAIAAGRTMFDDVDHDIRMKLVSSRAFNNGKVVLNYEKA